MAAALKLSYVAAPCHDDVFGGLTVAHAMRPRNYACHLRPSDFLGDFSDALLSSKRSAMGIVDEDGNVVGMLTVNDIMRAYFEGISAQCEAASWMQSSGARAPQRLLQRLVVQPMTPLAEVAGRMVANVVAGDCACHHILVKETEGGLHGVISSQDLLHFFCQREHVTKLFPDVNDASESNGLFVRDVMKDRDHVFTCEPDDTLQSALRTLLVTMQNSLLVLDDIGVCGLLTPMDMVKAFADAVSLKTTVAEWMKSRPEDMKHKIIPSSVNVVYAVSEMARLGVDHLVVVNASSNEAVGILSSLDLVLHTKAREPLPQAPTWSGPSVGEVLKEHSSKTALCTKVTTLGMVCTRLLATGQTSVIIEVDKETAQYGLLTESDIVRAFIAGLGRDMLVGDFLLSEACQHGIVPQYLQVPPSMKLTDAGALMLYAVEPGRSCHHIAVRSVTGGWRGVFSALDVARALHGLTSKLEVAKSGVDLFTVESIMKPAGVLPSCPPSETITDALRMLYTTGQSAVLVVENDDVLGLLTPRCAVQAMADHVSRTITVGEWMRTRHTPDLPREVAQSISVKDAADMMTMHSLHHLLVVDLPSTVPVGVLSALDLVRAVVSSNQECPFLSLGWLRRVGVSTALVPPAPHLGARSTKRAAIEGSESKPPGKLHRFEEFGA